jgi:hypothetical protein
VDPRAAPDGGEEQHVATDPADLLVAAQQPLPPVAGRSAVRIDAEFHGSM